MPRVLHKVISQLIFRRKCVAASWKAQPRKSRISCRAEETKRVPAVSPRVPDARAGVQDQEGKPAFCQIISDRKPCLSSSNDNGLNSLSIVLLFISITSPKLVSLDSIYWRIGRARNLRIGRNTHFSVNGGMGNFM